MSVSDRNSLSSDTSEAQAEIVQLKLTSNTIDDKVQVVLARVIVDELCPSGWGVARVNSTDIASLVEYPTSTGCLSYLKVQDVGEFPFEIDGKKVSVSLPTGCTLTYPLAATLDMTYVSPRDKGMRRCAATKTKIADPAAPPASGCCTVS